MNKFILFLNLVIVFSSCAETKRSSTAGDSYNLDNQGISSNNSSSQNEIKTIEYSASSRGYFFHIKIDEEFIQKTKDRNLKNIDSKKCLKKDWDTILSLIKTINVETIHKLKAPTERRLVDGAPHAELKIITAHQTYTSNGFDHGHPPEEIKQLVNTILSLAESIENE